MECLGIKDWDCGHTPGWEGEYCNAYYNCAADLVCNKGKCKDYRDMLIKRTKGTCRPGNPTDKIKIMTYNVFLLYCPLGTIGAMKCQSDSERLKRISKFTTYFQDRDEDVVVMQEVFTHEEKVIEAMAAAGYCHYVMNFQGEIGSGLAIFSKFVIEQGDFIDWADGIDLTNPERFSDKGVMYARINKDGKKYHVFNSHTQSNSAGDGHPIREKQFLKIRQFVTSFNIAEDELIMLGGDFNEDYFHDYDKRENGVEHNNNHDYEDMVSLLDADIDPKKLPVMAEGLKYSQDTEKNKMLKAMWLGDKKYGTSQELLDYVFISKNLKFGDQLKADKTSFCEILIPQVPKGCNEADCMLSDHFPNTCTFYTNNFSEEQDTSFLSTSAGSDKSTSAGSDKKSNGEKCRNHSDCQSKRCTHEKVCAAKLAKGVNCGNMSLSNSDCASGECSLGWSGWYCE